MKRYLVLFCKNDERYAVVDVKAMFVNAADKDHAENIIYGSHEVEFVPHIIDVREAE